MKLLNIVLGEPHVVTRMVWNTAFLPASHEEVEALRARIVVLERENARLWNRVVAVLHALRSAFTLLDRGSLSGWKLKARNDLRTAYNRLVLEMRDEEVSNA